MTRELKFRAYGSIRGEPKMIYDWQNITFMKYVGFDGGDKFEVMEYTGEVMEYTGIEDKNGKEIYEGDILYVAGVGNCEVVRNFASFVLRNKNYKWDIYFHEDQEQDIVYEVLGNIYENPELLEDK